MLIAGMTYSVVRAGIMMLIYLLSVVLSRQRDSLNSLGFSVTVIAMENPFSIGALGLQLSVLSTAGLILYFQFLVSIQQISHITEILFKQMHIDVIGDLNR